MSLGIDKTRVTEPTGRALKHVRWLWRSSTLRLTLMLSALFALGMALTVFFALSFGQSAIIERTDETLISLAASINLDEIYDNNANALIRPLHAVSDLPRPFAKILRDGQGSVFLDDEFQGYENWRARISRTDSGDGFLIALPLDDAQDALEVLSNILWTTTLIVVGIALLIGLGSGFWARRRLVRINRALSLLASGDLKARTGIANRKDDLDDLAQQVDDTAGELERLVAQTRHLSASIAHDLRTPLARLRSQLETLPESDKRGAALEEAARLSDIFDTIMRVAKIEAAQGQTGFEAVDLGDLADDMIDIFGPVVEDSGKSISLDRSNPKTVQADRPMLVQAIANLIQNAIIHGGSKITLSVKGDCISIADNGQGVPSEAYHEIIKPMVRLDGARETDGTGLGLALVKAVAERHGARLDFFENKPSGLGIKINFTKL